MEITAFYQYVDFPKRASFKSNDEKLKAIHMNDSKNPFASHKDRHEKIGEGSIGLEAFERMVNHPKLKGIPIYLETPNELEGYAREIRVLREMER